MQAKGRLIATITLMLQVSLAAASVVVSSLCRYMKAKSDAPILITPISPSSSQRRTDSLTVRSRLATVKMLESSTNSEVSR